MDDFQDPGPPPSLKAHHIFVYLIKRLDEQDDRLNAITKNTAGWRMDFVRSSRRSDFMTIALAVGHGLIMSAGTIGGILAGSYVIVFHNWYVQRIVGWFHAL